MFSISYDTVASFSQVTSLLMFVAMFVAVVAYAFWPRNGPHFERAQRRALDLSEPELSSPLRGGVGDGGNPDPGTSRGHQ